MEETWKPVVGYEGLYEVSSVGRVKRVMNVKRGNGGILKYDINENGYLRVGLYNNNKRRRYSVHRLVALAFVPNPLGKPQINHIDNDPSNNCYKNLEWVTIMENVHHCIRQGRKVISPHSKLSEEDVKNILGSSLPQVKLAEMFNMSKQQISRIKRRESWIKIKNPV